ncbi:MAG: hypothetical protein ACRDJI_07980 [Actinomycetota bacterium]
MTPGRRTLLLLAIVAVVGAPAVLLRGLCVGRACDDSEGRAAKVPFCSLPQALRTRLVDGFRDGRSPDVLAVTGDTQVTSEARSGGTWPSVAHTEAETVPIVFWGTGVAQGSLPEGTRLDRLAPTMAELIGLDRPHPEVRSGTALPEFHSAEPPRLAVVVAWKAIGSDDLEADRGSWPFLQSLIEEGRSTLAGDPGSLPLDPASILTTIGTGGLPRQHGIPAHLVRNEHGKLVRAWSKTAPVSVIATIGDDLDEVLHEGPKIGLVATDGSDRGLVGGEWYVDVDRDTVAIEPRDPGAAAVDMMADGFGTDATPDLLAIAADGSIEELDALLQVVADAAIEAADGSVALVVTATGSGEAPTAVDADEVVAAVEDNVAGRERVVEAAVPGGLFLDQRELAAAQVSEDDILGALRSIESKGAPLFADAFSGTAVSFAKYC